MKFYLVALVVSAVHFSATVDAAPTETAKVLKYEELSPESVGDRFSQYVQINSILALVSRLSQSQTAEIVSNLAKIQDEHPTSTTIGAYVANLRTLMKNQGALKWFDFVERAGIKQLEQLVHAKPELFAPLLSSLEHVMVDVTKGNANSVSAVEVETESPAEMDQATSLLLIKLRHGIEVVTALGDISRITPKAASEIDAAIDDYLRTTHGEDTTFGRYLMRTRTLLKNRRTLRWFDYLNKAGLGKIEQFITSLH